MSRDHRLAAIMFTDIQGYTKLMQEDEHKAIEFRKRHREIFQSVTSKHQGEIIQYWGDGTLSIFDSCVDAVRCAIHMQNQFQSEPAMPVRVGIHLGDIVLTEDDIIGNSVNIASRIESLGIPGSVIISQKVYDEIRNKQEFQVKKLGKFHFKNDKEPRVIYAVEGEKLIIPKRHELHGKLQLDKIERRKRTIFQIIGSLAILFAVIWGIDLDAYFFNQKIRSLAVLPLYDRIGLSSDDAYIIEGLHEEIITKMSKVGINVKPYSAMIPYRTNPKTPEVVGKELNVDGIVEGSLHRAEDIYRIRVQVVEVDNQVYISDPYEAKAKFAGILSIFSEIVSAIANQIKHILSEEAKAYLTQNQVVDPEAYDLYLRGRHHLNKGSYEDIQIAIDLYNKSLQIDSSLVDAHISLIESYLLLGFSSNNPANELEKFRYHIAMAIEKDPFFSRDHHMMGMIKVFDNWDWSGAAKELEKAMTAYPKSWEPYDSYCQLMWAMGDMKKSIEAGEKAIKVDPKAHYAHCDLAWAYYLNKNYDMAKRAVDKTIQMFGTDCPHHNGLSLLLDIASKNQIGQSLVTTIDRIEREIDTTENPVYNLSMLGYAHALEGNREEALEILNEMESKDIPGADKIYIALGDYNKALDLLEAAITNRSFFQMYTIKKMPWYDPLRSDPRFERILTRMGLADHQLK